MKTLITNYTFDKAAKTVTFTDYASINLERVLLIVNATSNIIIYNFADTTKGGTVSTNVLTLTYDTSAMASVDKLLIYYDDPNYTAEGSTQDASVAAGAVGSISAKLRRVTTDLDAVKTSVANIPASPATTGKQDTGNTSLASIDGKITAVNTGAVVVSSSALPSGAATGAKQDTTNATIATKNTAAPTVALQIGMTDGTNLQAPQTAVGDSVSPWLVAEAVTGLYNGLSIDRAKSIATGIQGVGINDGTNTVNVLKSDGSAAGQNAQMIGSAYLSQTWSVTSVSNLTGIDAGGYSWISIHITAQYVGSTPTITWQGSNDNTNWVGFSLVQPLSTLSSGSLSTAASNVIFSGPLNFRYVRLAFTGTYSSGTSTGTILLSTTPRQTVNINGQVAINGTQAVQGQATGSAVPANAFYQGLNTKTTSPTAASTGNLVGATGDIMGEQLVTTGGLVTTAVASGTSANTVIKASGGRLCRILVTTTNTNPMSIFDNATTNSGTIIASLPASPAVGTIYDLQMPAAAGITVGGNAANPGITISWI